MTALPENPCITAEEWIWCIGGHDALTLALHASPKPKYFRTVEKRPDDLHHKDMANKILWKKAFKRINHGAQRAGL